MFAFWSPFLCGNTVFSNMSLHIEITIGRLGILGKRAARIATKSFTVLKDLLLAVTAYPTYAKPHRGIKDARPTIKATITSFFI
jgi:hypothetical protein